MKIENLGWDNRLAGISLDVGAGEVVGLGGLDGQGQRTLLLALFGVLRGVSGRVTVNGRAVRPGSPSQAKTRQIAIALVPEDRKTEGLMLPMSITDNLAIASLPSLSFGPFVDGGKEKRAVDAAISRLRIRVGAKSDAVSTLSGGNQQKVVIAKWLMTEPRIILLNDPTHGIDIGTKQALSARARRSPIRALRCCSRPAYDELIGCCDRVAIMYDGRIVRELAGDDLNETNIIASALNIEPGAGATDAGRRPMPNNLATRLRQNIPFVTALALFTASSILSTTSRIRRVFPRPCWCRTATKSSPSPWWRWPRPCRC